MSSPSHPFPTAIASSLLLLSLGSLGVTAVAAEQPDRGWNLSLLGGFGTLKDTDLTGPAAFSGEGQFDAGFMAGAALRYDLNERWSIEGDYLYQTNDFDRFSAAVPTSGLDGGDYSAVAVSANVLYRLRMASVERLEWHVGAGLVWLQEIDVDFETPLGEQSFSTDDWGWQLRAGARYALSPRWQLSLDLRYFDAGALSLDGEGQATGSVAADYQRTSLIGGIGYRF